MAVTKETESVQPWRINIPWNQAFLILSTRERDEPRPGTSAARNLTHINSMSSLASSTTMSTLLQERSLPEEKRGD